MSNTSSSGYSMFTVPLWDGVSLDYNAANASVAPTSPAGIGWGWSLNLRVGKFPSMSPFASLFKPSDKPYYQFSAGNGYFTRWVKCAAPSTNYVFASTTPNTNNYLFTLASDDSSSTMTEKSGLKWNFDSSYLLTSLTDTNSNSLTVTRDGSNRVTSLSDGLGRSFTLNYTNPGDTQPSSIDCNDSSRHIVLEYWTGTNVGRLKKATDPAGNIYQFNYWTSTAGITLLATVTDPNSNVPVSFAYYNSGTYAGLVNTETQYAERTLTYTYGVDGSGNPTVSISDVDLTGLTSPSTRTSTGTYNQWGRLIKNVDPLSNIWTYQYSYSNPYLATVITDPNLGTITNAYDGNGNLISTTNQAGETTTSVYSSINLLLQTIGPPTIINGIPTLPVDTYCQLSRSLSLLVLDNCLRRMTG